MSLISSKGAVASSGGRGSWARAKTRDRSNDADPSVRLRDSVSIASGPIPAHEGASQ
ncbi:hypothetical protein JZ751_027319, partial [Albula glossodonta]